MGERLLMAVRSGCGVLRPVWLYHHWLGVKEYFVEMIATAYLELIPERYRGQFKRQPSLTDWVHALLSYADDMQVTDERGDRNYLAAIVINKHTYLFWAPLNRENFGDYEEKRVFERKFMTLISEYPETCTIDWAERNMVRPLQELFGSLNDSLTVRLDDPQELAGMMNQAIEGYRQIIHSLTTTYSRDALNNHPYLSHVIQRSERSIEHLTSLLAKVVIEGLE